MEILKYCFFVIFVHLAKSIIHQRSLIWTLKSATPTTPFDVLGIVGDPSMWVPTGYDVYSYSYFGAYDFRNNSRRDALSFDYARKRLFFSDNGFKSIFRSTVQEASSLPFVYNSTMSTVFAPTSSGVQALAFDWASGSLYWADSILNHIKVANSELVNIGRTIVSESLDAPKGIAVFPSKGLLYWTNRAGPRIEFSTLDGSDRRTLLDSDLVHPTTLSLDQTTNSLYFIDAGKLTLERVELTTRLRFAVAVRGNPTLSGLAHFSSFIFIADQRSLCIEILNKTTFSHVTNLEAGLHSGPATPYDLRMYDPSLQTPFHSNCEWLGCEHICISDGGQDAHCICADGYRVSPTNPAKCVLTSPCDASKCEHECVTDSNNQPKCNCPPRMYLFNLTHCSDIVPKTSSLVVDQPVLPTAGLIAIIVIAILFILVISILIFAVMRRRRRRRKPDLTPSVSYFSDTTTIVKTYSCQHSCDHSLPTTPDAATSSHHEDVYSEINYKDEEEDSPTNKMASPPESENNDYTMEPFKELDQTYENNPVFNYSNIMENGSDWNPADLCDITRNKNSNQKSETTDNFDNECKVDLKSKFSVFEPGNYISEIRSEDLMQSIDADQPTCSHQHNQSKENEITNDDVILVTGDLRSEMQDKSVARRSVYLLDATLSSSNDQNP